MAMFITRDMCPFKFGSGVEDLLYPVNFPLHFQQLRRNRNCPRKINRKDAESTVESSNDKFQVSLDVKQFTPEEIKVKVVDDYVVVEGKHEEKEDEHGFISRQFVRRYLVPKEYHLDDVQSHLSSDGILTISAPKLEAVENKEKIIPITRTGPHKIEQNSENKDEENKS